MMPRFGLLLSAASRGLGVMIRGSTTQHSPRELRRSEHPECGPATMLDEVRRTNPRALNCGSREPNIVELIEVGEGGVPAFADRTIPRETIPRFGY